MHLRRLALLAVVTIQLAAGAAYEDTLEGFRINYPDGWSVLSADDLAETREAVKDISEAAGGRARDPRVFVATETGVEPPEYAAHLNVVISPGRLVLDESTAEELMAQIEKGRKAVGSSAVVVDQAMGSIGANRGIVSEVVAEDPLSGVSKRQWQIITAGRQQVYTVICAAPDSEAERYRQICREALESFEKDVGVGGFLDGIPALWKDAVQGAVIVVILQLFFWWRKNRKESA
jgi:hypothetical protein